jgi:superfamily II DNA or RNA helicase
MTTNKIVTMLDEVHCHANAEARATIKFALAYKSEFWKRGEHHMEQEIKKQYLISGRKNTGGHFLTGLLPLVKKYCKQRKIKIKFNTRNRERIRPSHIANLPGITFRPDQIKIFNKINIAQRGKIIHPTGSGKTIIALGIVSMFERKKTMFVMHTKDLFSQAVSEANKFRLSLPPIFAPSGSNNIEIDLKKMREQENGLMICLIQSLAKIDPKLYIDIIDITIIDECHHVVSLDSQYGKFMQSNLSPRRYGFTATDSFKDRKKELVNIGLIGSVIGELSTEEALEKGIIAKPKVKLVNVPYNININKISAGRYASFYKYGIVENKARNDIISKLIKLSETKKLPTLTIVEKLDHGKNIQALVKQKYNLTIPFVQGKSETELRMFWKEALLNKDVYNIICSRVWMEGINIPNLAVIIYAAGYKEKKKVLQAMGRGLRTTDNKSEIILYDFTDPYRYLAEHTIQRIQVFIEQGWL